MDASLKLQLRLDGYLGTGKGVGGDFYLKATDPATGEPVPGNVSGPSYGIGTAFTVGARVVPIELTFGRGDDHPGIEKIVGAATDARSLVMDVKTQVGIVIGAARDYRKANEKTEDATSKRLTAASKELNAKMAALIKKIEEARSAGGSSSEIEAANAAAVQVEQLVGDLTSKAALKHDVEYLRQPINAKLDQIAEKLGSVITKGREKKKSVPVASLAFGSGLEYSTIPLSTSVAGGSASISVPAIPIGGEVAFRLGGDTSAVIDYYYSIGVRERLNSGTDSLGHKGLMADTWRVLDLEGATVPLPATDKSVDINSHRLSLGVRTKLGESPVFGTLKLFAQWVPAFSLRLATGAPADVPFPPELDVSQSKSPILVLGAMLDISWLSKLEWSPF